MYSSDLYQKALNRLDRRREEDELRTAATLAEVSAKVPRLEEIQNQLRQVAFPSPRRSLPKTRRRRSTSCKRKACACKGKRSGCWWLPVMHRTLWPTTISAPPARTPAM